MEGRDRIDARRRSALALAVAVAVTTVGAGVGIARGETDAEDGAGRVGEQTTQAAEQQAGGTQQQDGRQRSEPSTQAKRAKAPRARLSAGRVRPRKVFIHGRPRARFRFELKGKRKRTVVVKVKKVSSGKTQNRWRFHGLRRGKPRKVFWGGYRKRGGFTGRGRHVFKVYEPGRGQVDMRRTGRKRVRMFRNRFPIRGNHGYGDGLGAGRGHQGQDVFTGCGKKILAARAGRVQTRAYHSAAGYYMVIDSRGNGRDYIYMHMRRKGRPKRGSYVRTGQRIGFNSDTGNASGCHLHFEIWSKPGWYEGGDPVNPTRPLRKWDKYS